MAKRLFETIGRADMIRDPRFATNSDRVKHRPLVDEAVGGWFATRTRDEALKLMREASVTVGPVYTIADAMTDPHFRGRGIIVDVEDRELGQRADAQHRAAAVGDAGRAGRSPRRGSANTPMRC